MAGKGGGAWKVAYADFVTAMMAFFLVMWITAQNKPMREAVAQHFREPPGVFESSVGRGGPFHDVRPKFRNPRPSRFQPSPLEKPDDPLDSAPRLLKLHNGDSRQLGTVIVFSDDSAALDEKAKAQLRQLAPALAGKPHKIELRGHASRQPLPPNSPYKSVWDLSYARCAAAMAFLMEQGVPAERMRLSQGGCFEPLSIAPDAALQSRNPRVEVFVLSEWVDELVGSKEERENLHREW